MESSSLKYVVKLNTGEAYAGDPVTDRGAYLGTNVDQTRKWHQYKKWKIKGRSRHGQSY